MGYIFQFLCMKYEFLMRFLMDFRDLICSKDHYAYHSLIIEAHLQLPVGIKVFPTCSLQGIF